MSSCIPIPPSRALLHTTVLILCFLGVASSRPLNTQNITIEVPNGTTNHGEPYSFCTPATWSNIASYVLLNYVAHGATVVSYPGEPWFDMFLNIVAAIVFPVFGVIRAFNFIFRCPIRSTGNDLKVAARSGALCMLIRSPNWEPRPGDEITNALINNSGNESSLRSHNATSHSDSSTNMPLTTSFKFSIYRPPWLNDRTRFWSYTDTNPVGIGSRDVFGLRKPPDQYKFAFVPRNTEVFPLKDHPSIPSPNVPATCGSRLRSFFGPSTPKLSSSRNLVRGMVALLQLLYTSFTLYHANDGQVKQYGFVAPGLTVLPYAIMSGLNLIAGLVTPNYPTLYLVRSKVMEEAERRRGGLPFNYVVGEVFDKPDTNTVQVGWSEIARSFKDGDKALNVTPSAEEDKTEEDEKTMISDGSEVESSQIIYVPACPRFQRTDDGRTSPLLEFDKPRANRYELRFPRYMALGPRARDPQLLSWPSLRGKLHIGLPLNEYEILLVAFIFCVEVLIMLALSDFSGHQSTVAQKSWIGSWLFIGSSYGVFVYALQSIPQNRMPKISFLSQSRLRRILIYTFVVCWGGPFVIGGLVVVSQMLKAYGFCHRFV